MNPPAQQHVPEPTAFNMPNMMSAVRLPLAALFPLIDDTGGRIAIVLVAAATDWVDGRLARATREVTRTGELLDPVADKVFMLSALVTLAADGLIPVWTLPLLLVRDLGVAIGALIIAVRRMAVRMPARRAGKIVTWLQFAGIGALLLRPAAARLIAPAIAVAGVIALVDYGRSVQRMHRLPESGSA